MRISDLIIELAQAQANVGNVEVMHAHEKESPAFFSTQKEPETVYEVIVSVQVERLRDRNIVWFGV